MIAWYETKQFVERATTVSMDALHVFAGFIVFLLLCLVMRKPVTDVRVFLAVLLIALANEAVDLWVERWPSAGMQLGEAAKDVFVTMLLPAALLVSARLFPNLYSARRRR